MWERVKYILFIICIYFFVFQNFIQEIVPFVRYFDEILASIGVIFLGLFFFQHKKQKEEVLVKNVRMIVCILLLSVIGICSNLIYQYQPLKVALFDSILIFKFFFVYFLAEYLWSCDVILRHKENLNLQVKIITILLFLLTILNYSFHLWPSQVRFGIMSNRLFYTHPSIVASISIFLYSLFYFSSDKKLNIKFYFYNFIYLFLIVSTLRFKSIGMAFLLVIISLFIIKTKKKINLKLFIPLLLGVSLIGWNQIYYYYIQLDQSARSQLTVKSFEIAKDHFPFGTGFGTYGSHFSGVYYSPVYSMYRMENIQGISEKDPSFISDTFWPMILGQFGFIGLFVYLLLIYSIYQYIQFSFSKERIDFYLAKIISFTYLLVLSTSDSSFVNPIAIGFAVILGINVVEVRKNEES